MSRSVLKHPEGEGVCFIRECTSPAVLSGFLSGLARELRSLGSRQVLTADRLHSGLFLLL